MILAIINSIACTCATDLYEFAEFKENAVKFFFMADRQNLNIHKTNAVSVIMDHFIENKRRFRLKIDVIKLPRSCDK